MWVVIIIVHRKYIFSATVAIRLNGGSSVAGPYRCGRTYTGMCWDFWSCRLDPLLMMTHFRTWELLKKQMNILIAMIFTYIDTWRNSTVQYARMGQGHIQCISKTIFNFKANCSECEPFDVNHDEPSEFNPNGPIHGIIHHTVTNCISIKPSGRFLI